MAEDTVIVVVEIPTRKHNLFGMSLGRQILPARKPGMQVFASIQQPDGKREIRRMLEGDSLDSIESTDSTQFYHVRSHSYPFSPNLSKVITDEQGHKWDFQMHGRLSVNDPQRFLKSFAVNIASPDVPLTYRFTESWLAKRISPNVRDAIRDYSIFDLRERDVLPISWWEKQLNKWLNEYGITAQIDDVKWSSAQAEIAEIEAARQRDIERVEKAKRREWEAEVREAAAKAEYEKRKKKIELDLKFSDYERMYQLQLLEKRRRNELIKAYTQIEIARRQADKSTLEHEAFLANLRQDADMVNQLKERERQAEMRYREILEEFEKLKSTLARIADLPDNLLAQLGNSDKRMANAAAERLVSPEFGVKAVSLAELGFMVDRQSLVERLRQRASIDSEGVIIRKRGLLTRDIGTAKVQSLPINTTLQFDFNTERDGYVTVLNIGTSGSILIHVPNPYISPEQARIRRGKSYEIPGPELLPWEQIGDYVEMGPPGWEHIAVLVSDEPIISFNVIKRASIKLPFVKLTNMEISDICDKLETMATDRWVSGVLSFLV